MAKRKNSGSVNKSLEIRNYIAANPAAKPKEIVTALAEKGVVVSPAFVSTLKSNDKRKGGSPTGRVAKSVSGDNLLDGLVDLKKVVAKFGGYDKTRAALVALETLTS